MGVEEYPTFWVYSRCVCFHPSRKREAGHPIDPQIMQDEF